MTAAGYRALLPSGVRTPEVMHEVDRIGKPRMSRSCPGTFPPPHHANDVCGPHPLHTFRSG